MSTTDLEEPRISFSFVKAEAKYNCLLESIQAFNGTPAELTPANLVSVRASLARYRLFITTPTTRHSYNLLEDLNAALTKVSIAITLASFEDERFICHTRARITWLEQQADHIISVSNDN